MGGSTAPIRSSSLTSSFPIPWTAFQQAAQEGWRMVLDPVSIDSGLSLAVLIRMVHC